MSNSDELIIAGLKYGVLPAFIITLIIAYYARRRNPKISRKELIIQFVSTYIVCLVIAIAIIMILFIILMSGLLF